MPHFLSDAEIEHIGRGLLDRSLPKIEWTHAAHFAAALWLLKQPEMHAERDMPRMIRAYNEATGVPNTDTSGYHETITLGSLRAARAWLVSRPDVALYEALRELRVQVRSSELAACLLVEIGVVLGCCPKGMGRAGLAAATVLSPAWPVLNAAGATAAVRATSLFRVRATVQTESKDRASLVYSIHRLPLITATSDTHTFGTKQTTHLIGRKATVTQETS
jgi:hypothetical protein